VATSQAVVPGLFFEKPENLENVISNYNVADYPKTSKCVTESPRCNHSGGRHLDNETKIRIDTDTMLHPAINKYHILTWRPYASYKHFPIEIENSYYDANYTRHAAISYTYALCQYRPLPLRTAA